MSIKVCKFGGSSLADAAQVRKVRAIVAADPERRYVVPSAPGKRSDDDQKITDLLYLCHEHARQGVPFGEVFTIIRRRFLDIAGELGLGLDLAGELDRAEAGIAERAKAAHGPDYAASRGEYLNGRIIAEVLGCAFIDAAELIRFDANGRLDEQRSYAMIAQRLGGADRAVIPGFYGSGPDGEVITFSRGGSDVSGAIVARGVGAALYENWTDVPGLLMTDPRIVDDPLTIEVITYRELRELSYSGASVLHEDAVFPVRSAGIPVNIRSTDAPDHPGTRIVSMDDPEAETSHAITGIAGRRDFTIINVEKALMNTELGFGRRVLNVLEVNGISFEHMPSGIDTLGVVIKDANLEGKLKRVLAEIEAEVRPDKIDIDPDLALIATVGRGMSRRPGMAARLFSALGAAGVNIRMIDQGSSELNIIVGVNVDDFETAVRAIYHAFVE